MKQKSKLLHQSNEANKLENVLVMQGGGSLGAYECGVYKALVNNGIIFDVIAGTSIGAVNAALIVGAKDDKPEKTLEEFWLDVAEKTTPDFLPEKMRIFYSTMSTAIWGNPNMFEPILKTPFPAFFSSMFPYLYNIEPLKKTIEKYVDFKKLNSANSPRILVTSVDIQKAKAVTFDSNHIEIDVDHILSSVGFPFYGLEWTEKDGKFLWDGSLMSNTPLREVINASPKSDKNVYIVSLFPRNHDELPQNMSESWHRARDIMHTDKTEHNVRMSKVISRYLRMMKEMHDIISNSDLDENLKKRFEKIEPEYHKLACDRGAIIQKIIRIERQEESHYIFEDVDFSLATIKHLIKQGSQDAKNVLIENAGVEN